MHRLRVESRALLELVLLPGLAAVLPWAWCFALFRRLARRDWLYRADARASLAAAREEIPVADAPEWLARFRLARLVDHADFWLSRCRSDRWLDRHLVWEGAERLPAAPFVAVFFHAGPGFWPLRALARRHGGVVALAAPLDLRSRAGSWVGFVYGALRQREMQRAARRALLIPPGTVRRGGAALARGEVVMGAPDVPGEPRRAREVHAFGRCARLPGGLLDMARQAGVPVAVLAFPPDACGGRRLRVMACLDGADPALAQAVAEHWEAVIRDAPWAFNLWPVFQRFFHTPVVNSPE